jgi:hypothetical protein
MMTILVAPEHWMVELADSANPIPGILGDATVWELPAALDIDLVYESDSYKAWGVDIHRVTFTDPRASSERDDSMPSGDMGDGRTWFHADIMITVGKADKIFIMKDDDIAPSFLIELDGDTDAPESS